MVKKYLQTLDSLQTESAAPNGDCAFNAVALIFDDAKLAYAKAKLEKEHQDLTVFNQLVALRQQAAGDRRLLQTLLAPLLRQLSIQLIQNDPKRYFQTSLFNLISVFTGNRRHEDDIFSRHGFIQAKFAELNKMAVSAHAKRAALTTWWREEGYNAFLHAMKQKGAHAGDVELIALADYFGFNLFVKSRQFGNRFAALNTANGGLAVRGELAGKAYRFTTAQIRELTHRRVAQNGLFTRLDWEAQTQEELDAALSAIPAHQMVHDYLVAAQPVNGSPIPDAWKSNIALMEQLQLRGVVTAGKFAADNSNAATRQLTLACIAEIADKDFVVSAWQATYQDAPVMALQNEEAVHPDGTRVGHWDALVPKAPAPVAADSIVAKPSSTAFLNETLKLLGSGLIVSSESNWTSLVAAAEKDEAVANALPVTEKVTYDFGNRQIATTKKTAEVLDEELAKKIQQEEYRGYLTSRR